jgi:hypothetical protein
MAVKLGVEIRIRDDDQLGVNIHSDPFVEFNAIFVRDVEQSLQQVGMLAGVLDDGGDTVAL